MGQAQLQEDIGESLDQDLSFDPSQTLQMALEQNREVNAKVQACAEDLAASNQAAQEQIAQGNDTLSASAVLSDGQAMENQVQECADGLKDATETLSKGISGQLSVEQALIETQQALADTEAALASTRVDEQTALLRALHDATTGLPTRELFNDRIANAISLAERHAWNLAVLFLDLDHFKQTNDTHGHAVGDLVLKEVANRLMQHARDEDTVCRNGGDEFLYLLVNPKGRENVERITDKVLAKIAQPIDIGPTQLSVKASIGFALYPEHGQTGEQLVQNADAAMYRAKKMACGRVCF